ncbi:hypothetical protein PV797_04015 [Clostridiaceae bacterium M8S5]|nr:hypothetical protein PV797_04015 [Clostridiaceae bacterium M8S5]
MKDVYAKFKVSSFIMFLISVFFLFKGYGKMNGHDMNYAIALFVLATFFLILGIGLIKIGYLHEIAINTDKNKHNS